MMAFLKLEDRYINVAMITDVFIQDRRPTHPDLHADIYLAAPMGERSVSNAPFDVSTRHVHVSGEDADRLVQFLDSHLAVD